MPTIKFIIRTRAAQDKFNSALLAALEQADGISTPSRNVELFVKSRPNTEGATKTIDCPSNRVIATLATHFGEG